MTYTSAPTTSIAPVCVMPKSCRQGVAPVQINCKKDAGLVPIYANRVQTECDLCEQVNTLSECGQQTHSAEASTPDQSDSVA